MKKRWLVPFIGAALLGFVTTAHADYTKATVHISSAYTVLGTEDEIIVDSTPVTLTLPAASAVATAHAIKIVDATHNQLCTSATVCHPFNITVVPDGSDTIDGASMLRFQGEATLISNNVSAWQSTYYVLTNMGGSTTYGASSFSSTVSIAGLASLNGGLAMDTSVFTVADTTGVISWVPTTTTLSAGTFDFTTLTSGNGLKMIGIDATLNGGKYVNIFGGAGATSVWSIGEGGATLITPNVATIVPFYIDGTVTTSADLATIKAVDATLNGGKYINLLGGAGATSVWSVGESGATTITPNVGTVTAAFIDGTASTSGDLLKLKAIDATLNGGLYIHALGGAAGATEEFSVAEGGVVTAAGQSIAASVKVTATTNLMFDSNGDILIAQGTAVPVDTTTGYAKGCLFIDTDVASGTSGLYVNVGTNTSCVFKLVTNA